MGSQPFLLWLVVTHVLRWTFRAPHGHAHRRSGEALYNGGNLQASVDAAVRLVDFEHHVNDVLTLAS